MMRPNKSSVRNLHLPVIDAVIETCYYTHTDSVTNLQAREGQANDQGYCWSDLIFLVFESPWNILYQKWCYYGPWITLEYRISMHAVAVGLSSDYLVKAVWLFGSVHKTRCRQCGSKPCPRGRVPSKENKQKHIRYKCNLRPSINEYAVTKQLVFLA